jgi:hypothetical protein
MRLEMIERLTERGDRGQFLARAGAATLALVAGRMAGQPAEAHALVNVHGCHLCKNPDAGCPGNIVCFWCWWTDCHYNVTPGACHKTQCCEGYKAGGPCNSGCDQVACSAFGGQSACSAPCPRVDQLT